MVTGRSGHFSGAANFLRGHKCIFCGSFKASRVYQRLREALFHLTEQEARRLKGEIELGEVYFGGHHKGKRGRGAAGKSVVFELLEHDGRVYTKVVEQHVTAEELM